MSERKPSVFISYSHKDKAWKEKLVQHLGVVADEHGFAVWDDQRIGPGADWKAEITRAILSADVAVLLVSVDFLTSPFIKGEEIPPLLQRRREQRLDVVPVIARGCAWREVSWLSSLQARPEDGRPLSRMSDGEVEGALADIAVEVRKLLERAAQARVVVPAPPSAMRSSGGPAARPASAAEDHAVLAPPIERAAPSRALPPAQPVASPLAPSPANARPPVRRSAADVVGRGEVGASAPAQRSERTQTPGRWSPRGLARGVMTGVRGQPFWLLLLLVLPLVMVAGVYLLPRLLGDHAPDSSVLDRLPRSTFVARRSAEFEEDLGAGVKLPMVAISGGQFVMGSPSTEAGRHNNEGPQRNVTVAPFFLGKFEVTQAQWRAVARWPQVARALEETPSRFNGDDLPVEQVSWDEAVEFCARLSRGTGRAYRLPSEAEWEYAARAGTTTPFHFGLTITPTLVNYDGNYPYGQASKGEYRGRTTPVGSFKVGNTFGLFDMHGNVWEWVADDWHESYRGAPSDGMAWAEPTQGSARVIRGGSWFGGARYVRAAYRGSSAPGARSDDLGFRCARVQE